MAIETPRCAMSPVGRLPAPLSIKAPAAIDEGVISATRTPAPTPTPAPASAPLAVVDLSLPDEEAARFLWQACESHGFFYLTNHGLPGELMAKAFDQAAAFFSLPDAEKTKILRDHNHRGYHAHEEECLDPERQTSRGDTKELFSMGVHIPPAHPMSHLPMHGPNLWPNPEVLSEFRPIMEAYFEACQGVRGRLLGIMALALKLQKDYFHLPGMFDHGMSVMNAVCYSLEASDPDKGIFGCGAHTDFGMCTLLATAGAGLQICCSRRGSAQVWQDVKRMDGAFIVNIGDMLHRWTNGKWQSTLHRVIIPPGGSQQRYSIPFFVGPNFDCVVECLPTCVSPREPAKWPPVKHGPYLLSRFRELIPGMDPRLKEECDTASAAAGA